MFIAKYAFTKRSDHRVVLCNVLVGRFRLCTEVKGLIQGLEFKFPNYSASFDSKSTGRVLFCVRITRTDYTGRPGRTDGTDGTILAELAELAELTELMDGLDTEQ